MSATMKNQEKPPPDPFAKASSLPRLFLEKATAMKGRTLFRKRLGGEVRAVTWAEALSRVESLGAALIRRGFAPGDRAAVMADNGPEWAYADFAIQAAGGAVVPLYCTASHEQIGHILGHSGATFLFAGSRRYLERLRPHIERREKETGKELPCVILDGEAPPEGSAAGIETFLYEGPDRKERKELALRAAALSRDDVSSVIYTSGTTGPPKGVLLTHGNILSNIHAGRAAFHIGEGDVFLSLLPLSHAFERTMGFYAPVLSGAVVHFARSAATLARDLAEAGPTIVLMVPRFLEKLKEKIEAAIQTLPGARGALARRAMAVRLARARRLAAGRPPLPGLGLAARLAEAAICGRIREKLGGRTRLIVSGGAALPAEVWAFFHAAGVPVVEGYGLTETAPVISCNLPGREKPGSVGRPLDNVEVRIAPDGEILVKGPNVMKGYLDDAGATAAAVDGEEFFRTGDVGRIDEEGFLFITDRKKDIIVSASGKNIAPQNVENSLTANHLIEYACVFGEGKRFLVALLSPDMEALREELSSIDGGAGRRAAGADAADDPAAGNDAGGEGSAADDVAGDAMRAGTAAVDGAALIRRPEIQALFRAAVDEANALLAPYERIFRFHVVEKPFSIEGGEITPTLKVKRRFLEKEKYAALIEGLFEGRSIDSASKAI